MNIFPEKVVRTRGTSDGGFFSTIYSLDAWVNLGILGFCIAAFFFIALSPAISCIFALLFCIDIDKYERPYSLNVMGIFVSIYLLIDLHKGWIMSLLLPLIFDNVEMQRIIHVNHASMFTNLILLIFADFIFNLSGGNNFISFLIISGILFLSYHLSVFIF